MTDHRNDTGEKIAIPVEKRATGFIPGKFLEVTGSLRQEVITDDNSREEIKAFYYLHAQGKADDIWKAATENADKIVQERLWKRTSTLRDDFDEQLATKTQSQHSFRDNINSRTLIFVSRLARYGEKQNARSRRRTQ